MLCEFVSYSEVLCLMTVTCDCYLPSDLLVRLRRQISSPERPRAQRTSPRRSQFGCFLNPRSFCLKALMIAASTSAEPTGSIWQSLTITIWCGHGGRPRVAYLGAEHKSVSVYCVCGGLPSIERQLLLLSVNFVSNLTEIN